MTSKTAVMRDKRQSFTKRSGFTNVRVCLDCREIIGEGDLCKCPAGHAFIPGAEVTLCYDQARERPLKVGKVARLGNGRWRLDGTDEWYDLDGNPSRNATSFARARREDDEERIRVRQEKRAMLANVQKWKAAIRDETGKGSAAASEKVRALRAATNYEAQAKSVDPAALGEEARKKAVDAGLEQIRKHLEDASAARQNAAKLDETMKAHLAEVAALKAKIERLPDDVKTVLLLGDDDALRLYLTAE